MRHHQNDILDLDLGNSRMKYRCGSRRGATSYASPLPVFDDSAQLRRIRVSSVLGEQRNAQLSQSLTAAYGPECEFAQALRSCAGVVNGYRVPNRLGVDRWLAVVAAFNAFGPALVVDVGTAVTLDFVNDRGVHLGGYIVPGVQLLQQSLRENTQSVRFDTPVTAVQLQPGTDTDAAVTHGSFVTIVRLIEAELVRARQLCHHSARLVLCGGDAAGITEHLSCPYRLVADLVLDGLGYALP